MMLNCTVTGTVTRTKDERHLMTSSFPEKQVSLNANLAQEPSRAHIDYETSAAGASSNIMDGVEDNYVEESSEDVPGLTVQPLLQHTPGPHPLISSPVLLVRLPCSPGLNWDIPRAPRGFVARPLSAAWELYMDTVEKELVAMYNREVTKTFSAEVSSIRKKKLDISDYSSAIYMERMNETIEDEVARLRKTSRVLLYQLQEMVRGHFTQLELAPLMEHRLFASESRAIWLGEGSTYNTEEYGTEI